MLEERGEGIKEYGIGEDTGESGYTSAPLQKISPKSVHNFLIGPNPAYKQTNQRHSLKHRTNLFGGGNYRIMKHSNIHRQIDKKIVSKYKN